MYTCCMFVMYSVWYHSNAQRAMQKTQWRNMPITTCTDKQYCYFNKAILSRLVPEVCGHVHNTTMYTYSSSSPFDANRNGGVSWA